MKTEKRKTLQGSVLFTVVCVMALLIIFLTGTLALASASSNRAHKSYSSSQASYTARAAIESFTLAMEREPGLPAAIENMGNDPLYPEVVINDPSLGQVGCYRDDGTGKIVWVPNVIEIVPVQSETPQYIFTDANRDGKYEWVEVTKVRITATCRVGKEEETVSAYISKMPSGSSKSEPGGLEGLQEVGGNAFENGGYFTGGLGVGIAKDNSGIYALHNKTDIETKLTFVNGSVVAGTGSFEVHVKTPEDGDVTPYSQTIIMGNLWLNNDVCFYVDHTMDMKDGFTQKQVPYVYIDGAFVHESSMKFVQGGVEGHGGAPFNIFMGTYNEFAKGENPVDFGCADIYLMDTYHPGEEDDDYYKVLHCKRTFAAEELPEGFDPDAYPDIDDYVKVKKGDNYLGSFNQSCVLYEWSKSYMTKSNDPQNVTKGGNVYCKGNLTLGNVNIAGDVRVEGDCLVKRGVKIGGNLVVGGTLTIYDGEGKAEQKSDFNEWDKVYCDSVVIEGKNLNGKELQPGYVKHSDVRSGYKGVYNFVYENDPLPTEMYEYRKAKQSEAAGWKHAIEIPGEGLRVLGWGNEMTDGIKNEDYAIYALKDEYLDSVECVDGAYGFNPPYYLTNAEGFPTGKVIFSNKSIYRADPNDETTPFVDETGNYVQVDNEYSYYRLDSEGNILEEVSEKTATRPYFTKEGDSRPVTINEAYGIDGDENYHPLVDYPNGDIYPSKMTREAIYGEYDDAGKFITHPETKIVKNLLEMRKDLNLNEDGTYKPEVYHTCVPKEYCLNAKDDADTKVDQLPYAFNNDGSKNLGSGVWNKDGDTIIRSCIIGYNTDIDSSLENKLFLINNQIKITSNDTVWVVLRNINLDADGDHHGDILCDTSKGKVCFLIDGKLHCTKQGVIRNTDYYDGCTVKVDQSWGIEYYGKEDSSIEMIDPSTLVGTFLCPLTTFESNVAGLWEVNYEDAYGGTRKVKSPIVGSAMFKKVLKGTNDFAILNSGASSGKKKAPVVNTVFGTYQIDYFMGV